MSNAEELLKLATDEFKKLSLAETEMMRAAATGEFADCTTPKDKDKDPANAGKWGAARSIRAEVIRWLCTNSQARAHIDARGIRVGYAKVERKLDLSFAQIAFPLCIHSCAMSEDMTMIGARLPMLSLQGSHIRSIAGDGVTVAGDVFLRNGFTAEGEVRLLGATIGSNLECTGGTFTNPASKKNPQAKALNADGIDVKGDVFLGKNFTAKGQVRLLGATIGGDLVCNGASFTSPASKNNPDAVALHADRIVVKGGVFLRENFVAEGQVRLPGATIGGNLECDGGKFNNPASKKDPLAKALSADRIVVKGNVFLRNTFTAEGEVRLLAATIGGVVDCTNGKFTNPSGDALSADGIDVKGGVFLSKNFTAEGQVRLPGARIGGDLDCHNASFSGVVRALWLEGAAIAQRLILRDGTTVSGGLSLAHATVGQLYDDEKSWPEKGKLDIHGFVYDSIHTGSPATAKERLEWLRRQPAKPFRPQPYEQLAKVFRESGQGQDATKILIAKETDRRKHGDLTRRAKAWRAFLGFTIGYGYRTHRVFAWAACLWILGSFLFYLGGASGLMVYRKQSLQASSTHAATRATQESRTPPPERSFSPIGYSFDALVPVLNLHQEEYWIPDPSTCGGSWLRLYLWVHICMGWGLVTLGIAGVTGLVRK